MTSEILISETRPNVSLKDIAFGTSAVGIFYGTVAGLIWRNPQVGAAIGLGLGVVTGGILLGIESSNRAIELAREGKKVRAYLRALESTLEAAIGLAVAGAIAGFGIAGLEGAIWGAATGALIAVGGLGQDNVHRLSAAFRERNTVILLPL